MFEGRVILTHAPCPSGLPIRPLNKILAGYLDGHRGAKLVFLPYRWHFGRCPPSPCNGFPGQQPL